MTSTVLESPSPEVDLTNGALEDQPDQVLLFWDSPITEVDLTKWRLAKISLTAMVRFTE